MSPVSRIDGVPARLSVPPGLSGPGGRAGSNRPGEGEVAAAAGRIPTRRIRADLALSLHHSWIRGGDGGHLQGPAGGRVRPATAPDVEHRPAVRGQRGPERDTGERTPRPRLVRRLAVRKRMDPRPFRLRQRVQPRVLLQPRRRRGDRTHRRTTARRATRRMDSPREERSPPTTTR